MKVPIEIRLRLKVDENSPEAALNEYFNSGETPCPLRNMVMLPLMNHWLYHALKYKGASSQEVLRLTLDSIYRLQLHLKYLQSVIEIEFPEKEIPLFSSAPQPELTQPVRKEKVSESVEEDTPPEDGEEVDEGKDGDGFASPFSFTSKL